MLSAILQKKLVNVAMRTAEAFYNIFMYLYNKNILEYGQIARNGMESMIPDTEGRSTVYGFYLENHYFLRVIDILKYRLHVFQLVSLVKKLP